MKVVVVRTCIRRSPRRCLYQEQTQKTYFFCCQFRRREWRSISRLDPYMAVCRVIGLQYRLFHHGGGLALQRIGKTVSDGCSSCPLYYDAVIAIVGLDSFSQRIRGSFDHNTIFLGTVADLMGSIGAGLCCCDASLIILVTFSISLTCP